MGERPRRVEGLDRVTGSWAGRTTLVTGAGGFVGSWLALALAERGARVVGLVFPSAAAGVSGIDLLGLRERIEVVETDVADLGAVLGAVDGHGVDSCFHLAAQAVVGVANESPLPTFAANVAGTWNVLEACRRSGRVDRIVVASSDKAYGDHDVLPYTESLPLNGRNPYDASKACADILARAFAHSYALPVAVTRMVNIYGGGDRNWSRIVPGTIRSVLLDEQPVIRSDGTPVRDYLYVEDAVAGYLALAESLPATAGEAFNFGSGSPISTLELVRLIVDSAGAELKPRILGGGKLHGEIDRQYLDSRKAERVLGWKAGVPLREGIERTIGWYRGHAAALE